MAWNPPSWIEAVSTDAANESQHQVLKLRPLVYVYDLPSIFNSRMLQYRMDKVGLQTCTEYITSFSLKNDGWMCIVCQLLVAAGDRHSSFVNAWRQVCRFACILLHSSNGACPADCALKALALHEDGRYQPYESSLPVTHFATLADIHTTSSTFQRSQHYVNASHHCKYCLPLLSHYISIDGQQGILPTTLWMGTCSQSTLTIAFPPSCCVAGRVLLAKVC